jgi:hypothetical protein
MKFLRNITSGMTTLLITAVVIAIYLFSTFGNENPLISAIALVKSSLLLQVFIASIALHFFMKGAYRAFKGGKRHIASAGYFISVGIIIVGLVISANVRETETKQVVVSDEVDRLTIKDIKMKLPESLLVIGDKSEFKFSDLEVVVEEKGRDLILRPFPLTRTSKGFSYINDAGLSPTININSNGNAYLLDKMQLMPPGREFVAHLGDGVKAVISIKHGRKFKKGRLSARQYDLTMPGYNVLIKKGKNTLFEEAINGGGHKTKGKIKVIVGKTEKWAEIVLARDLAVYVIYAGLTGIVIFMLLYPLEFYMRFLRR